MEDAGPPAPPAAEGATSGDAAGAASAPAPAAASTTEGADAAAGDSKSDAGTATADAPAESKEGGGAGDDAEGRAVLGALERAHGLGANVVFGEQHDATRLAQHQLPKGGRAGEEAQRKTHLADDIIQRPVRANSFTCN